MKINKLYVLIIGVLLMAGIFIVAFFKGNQICESQYTLGSGSVFANIQLCDIGESLDNTNNNSNESERLEYDDWTDFMEEKELPYADEETFEVIKKAYKKIDFSGEFEKGNEALYDEYKDIFRKLLHNETPFLDRETGKKVYIENYGDFKHKYDIHDNSYYFFNVDGDEEGTPELVVRNDVGNAYVFKYDSREKECIMWYSMENYWYLLLGSRKVAWPWNGQYLVFYQLNQDGEVECETFLGSTWFNEEESLHVIMMPRYPDVQKEEIVTEEMKKHGIYERSGEQWYFRITDEQYELLLEDYMKAYELANEKNDEVIYTYNELFGIEGLRKEIDSIDFSATQPCMEISQEEDTQYRQAYLKVLQNEMPVIDEIGEKQYYSDLWRAGLECGKVWEHRTEKDFPYEFYYNDLDGDGLPELAINQGCFYIFKYEPEKKECRILYSQQSCYFGGILGVGKLWYHDGLHGGVIRDSYIVFDGENEWNIVLDMEQGVDYENPYYLVGTSEDSANQMKVDEENWRIMTKPFFDATEETLSPQSFEEVFGGLYEKYNYLLEDVEQVIIGAGNYDYFIRKDGTVFSIMEYEYDGAGIPFGFIFPSEDNEQNVQYFYYPEELNNITVLNESTKEGYTIYYDLMGVENAKLIGSDGYTMFLYKEDGSLWFWNSDRIKYHDNELALTSPVYKAESTEGSFVEVNIKEILGIEETSECPLIVKIQSEKEYAVKRACF